MNTNDSAIASHPLKPGFALFAGAASIVTVIILIIVKTVAYLHSGSTSVLASLTDSIVDAGVSLVSFSAIGFSLKPADDDHRYGHGKIEGLAAVFQAAFICGAGVFLVLESLRRFTQHEPVADHFLAMAVMGFSMAASIALVMVQKLSLKYAPSLAVEADKAHYATDVFINGGVMLILFALYHDAPDWVDPAFSLLVALYLAHTAWGIGNKGVDMLLDRELPDEMREKLIDIIQKHPETKGVHDLRTRKSGMMLHIAFDLEIDPDMLLRDAHAVSLEIEQEIMAFLPNAEIMIHKDPAGIPHKESRHHVPGVHD